MQLDLNMPDGLQEKTDKDDDNNAGEATNGYTPEPQLPQDGVTEAPVCEPQTPTDGPSEVPVCEIRLPPPSPEECAQPTGDELAATAPPAQRDVLVAMAEATGMTLFVGTGEQAYASVPIGGHVENWALDSRKFKLWLHKIWRDERGKGIGHSVVVDVVHTLESMAAFGADRFETNIRIAHHKGDIYVDLCNEQWQAIRITSSGWGVVSECPVKFIRMPGMLPLPMPIHNGSIEYLEPLINTPTDDLFRLVVSWIIGAFSPGPYPVLIVKGEQGSAKSVLCRTLRRLIDPSEVEVTSAPRDEQALQIAAGNSHVVALDNLSGVLPWLSDAICRLATGDAGRGRKLYSDNEEVLFKAKKPVVINGIDFATRPDLITEL